MRHLTLVDEAQHQILHYYISIRNQCHKHSEFPGKLETTRLVFKSGVNGSDAKVPIISGLCIGISKEIFEKRGRICIASIL